MRAFGCRNAFRMGCALFALWVLAPGAARAVEGLAGGKCILPWAYTVPPGVAELEPAVSLTTFDIEGRTHVTTLDFRVSWGMGEKLEMGAGFGIESANWHPEDASREAESETSLGDLGLGWKYRVWGEEGKPAVAVQWGVGLPWVSDASFTAWEAGLIYSTPLGEMWSLDVDWTFALYTQTETGDPELGLTWDVGIGADLSDRWSVAVELNGFFEKFEEVNAWKITPTLGAAYGVKDSFGTCLVLQQDIPGLSAEEVEEATVVQILFTFAFENTGEEEQEE